MKVYKVFEWKKTVIAGIILAIFILLGCFFLNRGYNYFMKRAYPLAYTETVAKEAMANHLEPALVYSVIKAESNFDADAKSRAGAIGLMQLTPDTFDWLQTKLKSDTKYTAEDLSNPEINIRYGCKFLSLLFQKYSRKQTALSAYNAGPSKVDSWLKDPTISQDGETLASIPYEETRRYVDAVLGNYDKYSTLYQFNSKGESTNG
jgi:soluble lytic murein transglycosylase